MAPFTVLLPTYDRSDLCEYFPAAVDSCLNNTVPPYEVLIVVDGPVRDEFRRKIVEYEKLASVRVLWLPKNIGLTGALNEGLRHVQTKYVMRADGDDINRAGRFGIQISMLNDGADIVGGAIVERDAAGAQLAVKRCPEGHAAIMKYGLRRNPFNHMTVAFNLEAALSVGGYPDLYLKEDWGLWTLMLAAGFKAANTSEVLVDATADINMYRRRGGLRTIISEYYMQNFLIEHMHKNVVLAYCDLIMKSIVLLVPAWLRGLIYRKLLRDMS